MSNALDWFEIPVVDMPRALRFYRSVLQAELSEVTFGGARIAVLPYAPGGVGGALALAENQVPSLAGSLVYLGAGDDLDGALARVQTAGGTVLMGRTLLSEQIGSIAFFKDSEGNRIGLHSPPSPPSPPSPSSPPSSR